MLIEFTSQVVPNNNAIRLTICDSINMKPAPRRKNGQATSLTGTAVRFMTRQQTTISTRGDQNHAAGKAGCVLIKERPIVGGNRRILDRYTVCFEVVPQTGSATPRRSAPDRRKQRKFPATD